MPLPMRTWIFLLLPLSQIACGQSTSQKNAPSTTANAKLPFDHQSVLKRKPDNLSIAELRNNTEESLPSVILISDKGREGLFKLDDTDKTSPDNTGMVVVTANGKRYKRIVTDNRINLRYFGAIGNGKSDDTRAIQQAVNYCTDEGLKLVVPKGTYRITSTIIKPQSFSGLNVEGVENAVIFNYSEIPDKRACLKIIGGSGVLCRSELSGITFIGHNNSVGIEISGQCGQRVSDCTFKTNQTGILFHNEAKDTFTEHCVAENCVFENECQQVLLYRKGMGNVSFHGSGLSGRNLINTKKTVIVVEEGSLPYNCPLKAQIWINAPGCILVENRNKGTNKPTFIGELTLEKMGNSHLTLATGTLPTYFCGTIASNGDGTDGGQFVSVQHVSYQPNGTVVTHGARYNKQVLLKKASNKIEVPLKQSTYMVNLYLTGPNYDYRYILIVQHEGGGGKGAVAPLANTRSFNGAGWGAPTFTCDEEGQLIINNPNFSDGKVTAWLTYSQIGDVFFGNTPKHTF